MAQSSPLDFALDRSSEVPVGTQLAWKLRGAIASGRLRPGDRLPGVRELAAAAAVNVNTVRAVYARLADQGAIVSQHGRGTFVAEALADESELRALAERTARDASARGVDPRELAAILFSQTATEGSRAAAPADQPQGRQQLRARIARLERDLAELDQEMSLLDEPLPPGPAPEERRPVGARVLAVGELEAIHESLAMQAAERRVQLELARERHRLGDRPHARVAHSVSTRPAETVVTGGSWTLRWRA
jgi:GntR family transcriptional regulator